MAPAFRHDDGAPDPGNTSFVNELGIPTPPPPPPTASPRTGSAPPVSSTPNPGQGVATDSSGRITAIVGQLTVLGADPSNPTVGAFWYRSDTSQFCIQHDSTTTKRVTLT